MVSTLREQEVFLLQPGRQVPEKSNKHSKQNSFILVVEDDPPTLRLERVIMEEEGYRVEVVGSGESALEFLADHSPSLVLLDIGLPGMDGFATCARIRQISQVPIIMVTGRDGLDDKVKGMDGGADDYVTKPFLTHELATRVKVVLRRTERVSREQPPAEPVPLPVPAGDQQFLAEPVSQPLPPVDQQSPVEPVPPPISAGDQQFPAEPVSQPLPPVDQQPPVEPVPPPVSAGDQQPPAEPVSQPLQVTDDQPGFGDAVPEAIPGTGDGSPPPQATSGLPATPDLVPDLVPDQVNGEVATPEAVVAAAIPASDGEAGISMATGRSYEGTVRLTITTLGPVRNLINFVSDLRQNPKFRLLRLVANQRTEGMDIWLGLRGPMPLIEILNQVHGVHSVVPGNISDKETADQLLMVTLD